MPDSSTASWSAVSLLTGYASRAISPVGVVSDVARRMREWEPLVNAVTTANLDDALGAARESERRWREGSARPLEGVPVMVKDLIDTAGLRTARGSAIFDDRVPCADAAVVRRVREAGAVIVAKTATHEFGWGITTESAHFGPTRNPWNIERSPGGSSGGSAAGLAAGYGPLALGTDTAGSVRIPAGFCGVVGLRPTFGAIETSGVFPLAPSLDQVGLMARTVSDVRLLWSSLGLPATTRDAVRRIGLPMGTDDAAPIDPAIATTCESAAAALADAGYEIIEFPPDCIPPAYSTLASTILSEGYRTHRARGLWPDRAGEYGTDVRRRLELAEHVDRAEYSHAAAQRVVLQATMSRIFQTVDVLLSPVSLTAPTYVGREDPSYRERVMSCTAPQSLAGLPSLVVRAGFDNGMPIGVQLTAQPRGEAKLLHIGTHLEELNGPETERWPEIPALTGPVEQSGPTYQHEEN